MRNCFPVLIFPLSISDCRIRDDFEKEDAFRGLCAMVCLLGTVFSFLVLGTI